MRLGFVILGVASCAAVPTAQDHASRPLSALVAEANSDVHITLGLYRESPASLNTIVNAADLIIRGVIDEVRSRLTGDGRSIETDYLITNPQIFVSRLPRSAAHSADPQLISFTMPGGTIVINGHRATVSIEGVVAVSAGKEVVVLLQAIENNKFTPFAPGLFEIRASIIVPLVTWEGDHLSYGGRDVDIFLNDILNGSADIGR